MKRNRTEENNNNKCKASICVMCHKKKNERNGINRQKANINVPVEHNMHKR